ncbi:hypothetical protein ColKHC_04850 [Colletotrichum higginsianum]|nr:hypothetical protein ColKHC_04850 [Colletotrichum higginsianum]
MAGGINVRDVDSRSTIATAILAPPVSLCDHTPKLDRINEELEHTLMVQSCGCRDYYARGVGKAEDGVCMRAC